MKNSLNWRKSSPAVMCRLYDPWREPSDIRCVCVFFFLFFLELNHVNSSPSPQAWHWWNLSAVLFFFWHWLWFRVTSVWTESSFFSLWAFRQIDRQTKKNAFQLVSYSNLPTLSGLSWFKDETKSNSIRRQAQTCRFTRAKTLRNVPTVRPNGSW